MQILYRIHCIISDIFCDKYKHWQWFYVHWYLKSGTNNSIINSSTEEVIYQIYKWAV